MCWISWLTETEAYGKSNMVIEVCEDPELCILNKPEIVCPKRKRSQGPQIMVQWPKEGFEEY